MKVKVDAASASFQGVPQPAGFPPVPSAWKSEWETYPGADGALQLFMTSHWAPEGECPAPHRAVVVFHGISEHGGRYLHFPHYLKGEAGAVFLPDHRAHGRAEGVRGYVPSFDLFASDAALTIRRIEDRLRKRFGRAEIHVVAHSMGGLVLLRTLREVRGLPIRSITFSAPLLGVAVPVPAPKLAAAWFLSKTWGSLQMAADIDPAILSHDPAVHAAHRADRLINRKLTPAFFFGMRRAIDQALTEHGDLEVPAQFLVPLQDSVVDAEKTLQFFRALKMRDKFLRTYPNFFHEPFNEMGKEQAFDDLKAWMRQWSA